MVLKIEENLDGFGNSAEIFQLFWFSELETHVFRVVYSDADTLKNALFPREFENRYPLLGTEQERKMKLEAF